MSLLWIPTLDKQQTPQERLDLLLSLSPKREAFPSEEAYQEALAGYRHSHGQNISRLRAILAHSPSLATAKSD